MSETAIAGTVLGAVATSQDRRHRRIRVVVAGARTVAQLGHGVLHVEVLLVRIRPEITGVASRAVGSIGSERPGRRVAVRRVTGRAQRWSAMVARVLRRDVGMPHGRPGGGRVAAVTLQYRQPVTPRLAGRRGAVVALRTGSRCHTLVVEGCRQPCNGRVAHVAALRRRDMGRRLAGRAYAVVALRASARDHARMVEPCGQPGRGDMTGITVHRGRDVVRCLAGGGGAVVTAKAGSGYDAAMIKVRPLPRVGGVAVITAVAADHVVRCFACSCCAIVTTEAGTNHHIVVHAYKWFPELIRVTFLT